jgi:DNA-binding SARP family transcriptional activator
MTGSSAPHLAETLSPSRIRLCGRVDVEIAGREVVLRGRVQRALLARLVLSLGESVPDRLLEDLWGDDQPASGGTALRVRVS